MRRQYLISTIIIVVVTFLAIGQVLGLLDRGASEEAEQAQPAPVTVDDKRFEQIEAVLEQSPTGQHLLNLKETYHVVVIFESGSGSRFRQNANLILLDASYDTVKAALFFAHEMYHAQTFHEGTKADIKSESREAYVAEKLMEEAVGMAISVQIKMELEAANHSEAGLTLPLETQYRETFQNAVDQGRAAGTNVSDEELQAIGKQAGIQALYDAFASGEVKTSNTYEPYPEYYGRDWEEAHPMQVFLADLFSQVG